MGRLRYNKNALQILQQNYCFINTPINYYNKWTQLFQNKNPIHVEIGCGKGSFIIEKAIQNKNINFIAIDKYPTILVKLNNKLQKVQKLNNLLFTSFDANQINKIFAKNTISKIYLNFSDPWPKKRNCHKRLTNTTFLNLYKEILIKNGIIEFKTDNDSFYEFTLDTIKKNNFKILYLTNDLYRDLKHLENNVATDYEKKFVEMQIKIKKIIFMIN